MVLLAGVAHATPASKGREEGEVLLSGIFGYAAEESSRIFGY